MKNLEAAIHILNNASDSPRRFRIDDYAGRHNSNLRQILMTVLVHGESERVIPKAKCGISALQSQFYKQVGIDGGCPAEREERFEQYCVDFLGIQHPFAERKERRERILRELDG